MLTEELAGKLARVALANIRREYPRHIQHLMSTSDEELRERVLHPAFYGSYDWHSAVHMHWLLMRVLRLYPVSRVAPDIADALDAQLTPEAIAKELEYFKGSAGRTFERPYGWAWLLELQAEALAARTRWSRALAPLATELAQRFARYVAASPYPIRAGAHGNTAFACVLALDYACTAGDTALEFEIRKSARRWYERDRDAPIGYEPSLDDFLSPGLSEALLMSKVLEAGEFQRWLQSFAPVGFGALAEPPTVLDHADPKQSHLDGLCLTRAWCLARLGDAASAERLVNATLPHVVEGDYAGTHWLASFAALALGERP
ncbi:MAG TPA: DUF2891 domain-containing protein [Burkholderiales bacterium]|nr:DUF2891 domain-containing protein [Burkholderiales bacterium]